MSRVAIAVEKLPRRRRWNDALTNQSNNFGVSCKRFKLSTPVSVSHCRCCRCSVSYVISIVPTCLNVTCSVMPAMVDSFLSSELTVSAIRCIVYCWSLAFQSNFHSHLTVGNGRNFLVSSGTYSGDLWMS